MSNFLWPHGLQYGSQASLSLTISQRVWMTAIQLCPTFSDPMDCSLPDSSVHGIVQTRILKWTSISFYRGSSWPRGQTQVSCIAGRFYYLPEVCSNSCPWSQGCHSTISSSVIPFSSCLHLSQHQGLSQGFGSLHQVAKILELQHQFFQWIFSVDFL